MALWKKLSQSSPQIIEQVKVYYGSNFPIEVRFYLADWLESRLLNNHQKSVSKEDAKTFYQDLLNELVRKANEMTDGNLIMAKYRLLEAVDLFQRNYSLNEAKLFHHMINCMYLEQELLYNHEEVSRNAEINALSQLVQNLIRQVQNNEHSSKQLNIQYEDLTRAMQAIKQKGLKSNIENSPITLQELKRQHDLNIQWRKTQLMELQKKLLENIQQVLLSLEEVKGKVLEKFLTDWKKSQVRNDGNQSAFGTNYLEILQGWIEKLIEILWNTREHVSRLQAAFNQTVLSEMYQRIESLLINVIQNSLIVEKQPPRIIKTLVKICPTIEVRLLFSNLFNMKMNGPAVKAFVVSEIQAQEFLKTGRFAEQSSGDLTSDNVTMNYNIATNSLTANFRSLQIKKILHADKKENDSVTSEKFVFVFQTKFADYQVSVMSLPFVVIVSGRQKPQAAATIFWDYSFADPTIIPLDSPDQVSWNDLSKSLNKYFASHTGRELTQENMHVLAEKLCKCELEQPIPENIQISRIEFCKENLQDRNFSFWTWFYSAREFIRDHLRGPWCDGSVIGFISKKTAEDYLIDSPPGTFLLRFSDSELGGVSIAWTTTNSYGYPYVLHVGPITAKHCSVRTLPDHLEDLGDLKFLYPNKTKFEAFKKYITRSVPIHGKSPYVGLKIRSEFDMASSPKFDLYSSPANSVISSVMEVSQSEWDQQKKSPPSSENFQLSNPGSPENGSMISESIFDATPPSSAESHQLNPWSPIVESLMVPDLYDIDLSDGEIADLDKYL